MKIRVKEHLALAIEAYKVPATCPTPDQIPGWVDGALKLPKAEGGLALSMKDVQPGVTSFEGISVISPGGQASVLVPVGGHLILTTTGMIYGVMEQATFDWLFLPIVPVKLNDDMQPYNDEHEPSPG